ncbi:alpha/beta hydrolase [Allohahella sp. A8]|uniref:alpha/beta hydrolase n=1 Tax=Allohahella sp. A8 TaxID=3141461 RepID=UPI000C0A98D2|nr:carboxylesterase [Hahellaceae bacterium]|tara:strand:+ start:2364 stop:3035 length:672 start_codon:yes stop_codon:yes gene_type:complete
MLPALEIETSPQPDAAVILLHGLGADGNDFGPIVSELKLPPNAAIRFIFPHAPAIPVTINRNYVMPAWYDITSIDIDRTIDAGQLRASAEQIAAFVDREVTRGIPPERIVIAGFSQGGAVAYELAASDERVFAGLLVLSSYFATQQDAQWRRLKDKCQHMPVMIMHGQADNIVSESLGRSACKILCDLGLQVSYKTYPVGHSVHPRQIEEISKWLQTILPVRS